MLRSSKYNNKKVNMLCLHHSANTMKKEERKGHQANATKKKEKQSNQYHFSILLLNYMSKWDF